MRDGWHFFQGLTFTALLLSHAAASGTITSQEVQSHLNALSTVQSFQQASEQEPCHADAPVGSQSTVAPLTFAAFASTQSCTDLLSLDPPRWISQTPGASIFKDPASWFPVCSPYWLDTIRGHAHPISRKRAAEKLANTTLQFESCPVATEDRYSGKYQEPSQEAYQLQPMSPEARAQLALTFEAEKSRLATVCCGSDFRCQSLVNNIALRFCKPQTDPKAPDPCVTSGTHFKLDNWPEKREWLTELRQSQSLAKMKSRFPLTSGTVTVSPFENAMPHQSYFGQDLLALRHELGHACSRIKRDLLTYQSNSSAIADYYQSDQCSISATKSTLYKNLTDGLKLLPETFFCLESNAKSAKFARFDDQVPCSGACESSYLEESLANVIALAASDKVSTIFPSFCDRAKDSIHGRATDDLRCALSTPAIRKKFEDDLGCKR